MPARSNINLGVARAWTAAVGGPVERHVRPHLGTRERRTDKGALAMPDGCTRRP